MSIGQTTLTAYQSLFETTLAQMAEIIEGRSNEESRNGEDALKSLVAIQKLRHTWLEGQYNHEASQHLMEFSFRLPPPQGVQIRSGLESIQTWLAEMTNLEENHVNNADL
jgi:hypothetical protein